MLQQISWDEAVEVVSEDVTAEMNRRIPSDGSEGGGFDLGAPFTVGAPSPMINGGEPIEPRSLSDAGETIHVVPWVWTGVDSVGLFGLGHTFERVTVHGVTFVTKVEARGQPEDYQLYRYVDWLDVFAQAGISPATRPVVDARKHFDEAMLQAVPELREAYDIVARRESGGTARH